MNSSEYHALYLALPPTIKSLVDASPSFKDNLMRLRLTSELERGADAIDVAKAMLECCHEGIAIAILRHVRDGLRCHTTSGWTPGCEPTFRIASGAPEWAAGVVDATDVELLATLLARPDIRPHVISWMLFYRPLSYSYKSDLIVIDHETVRDRMALKLGVRARIGVDHAHKLVYAVLSRKIPNDKDGWIGNVRIKRDRWDSFAWDGELSAAAAAEAVKAVKKSKGVKMTKFMATQPDPARPTTYRDLIAQIPDVAREVADVAQEIRFRRYAHLVRPSDPVKKVLYAEADFKPLFAAFRSVNRSVNEAANRADAADNGLRRVRASKELTLRFRKEQELDLGTSGPCGVVKVPKCTLTFSDVHGLAVFVDDEELLTVSESGVAKTRWTTLDATPFVQLLATLQAGNFQKIATRISSLTRECVFCSHPLTDASSIKQGAGDHCMKKYGRAYDDAVMTALANAVALPEAAARHVENVRVREVLARLEEGRRLPPHVMWLVEAASASSLIRGRSDFIEGLCECIEAEANDDGGCPEALEATLMDLVGRLTGATDPARACKDLERVRASGGAWLPAVIGLSPDAFASRLMDACLVAEHLGCEPGLVEWIASVRFYPQFVDGNVEHI